MDSFIISLHGNVNNSKFIKKNSPESGGTAILWKTSLDSNICGIDLKYDWCSQENGYIWSSWLHLPDNTFTYVSEAWGSTSWLDHCFATKAGNNIITSISVDYDCHLSDHFPLNINVCCDLAPKLEGRCRNRTQKIDWAKASHRDAIATGIYTDTLRVRMSYCGTCRICAMN